MTTTLSTRFHPTPLRVATVTLCLMLGGCTLTKDGVSGNADYTTASKRTQPLDVPPDLTQLQRDSRYLPQGGVINASDVAKRGDAVAAAGSSDAQATPGTPAVALDAIGGVRLHHEGTQYWLSTKESPEVVWPKVRDFWVSQGYEFTVQEPKVGVLETDWAVEKNSKPSDLFHEMMNKVFDSVTDAGLRNRYRTRLERQPDGSTEVFVTQFGAIQERTGVQGGDLTWVPRPSDPQLEAQVLSRMMLSLAGASDTAVAAVAPAQAPSEPARTIPSSTVGSPTVGSGPNGAARARIVAGQPGAALQVDDNFDRAWRRVGLALDHGGFTVEDRDRAQGLYYVRYVNAQQAAKEDSGVVSRVKGWFGSSSPSPVGKYRVSVKASGDSSTVTILNDQGQPDNSDNARHIVSLMVDELK